jgi:pimeloyl-ACP methyl ester carboxylesterase
MFATPQDVQAYWIDTIQRSILFFDTLRKRGNQYVEHYEAGKPPVLTFDYAVVMDGATLERPSNYMLLRIVPPAGVEPDPAQRPFVVFDPRAGHGPGIGGMKEASQVGVAMRAGHPVYFVSFKPDPVPGQTLRDVAWCQAQFLRKVAELHPDAEGKPTIVGNCQAGWAIMMLSAYEPSLASVIAVAGAPLSYWAGREGKDPMRYLGGLMGGNWLSALMADMGHGTFDGANLVANFENLNPANTLIGKPYNLYSKVDTEEARFLGFERWWGGYFLMTKAEIMELTSELFVGNKLAQGRVVASDGTPIDLRAIRAPIVVICSEGDNITPPAQALNWILDLYANVEEMRANEQAVVYTVHPTIGHLGIFVSARVALKEHAEFVNSMDLIEALPPGLYEMVVEQVTEDRGCESYTVRFEARTFDHLHAYDDGRDDEAPFRSVAKVSEINEGLYETYLGPMVRATATEATAKMTRALNPARVRFAGFSDLNPWMLGVKAAAEIVRSNRAEAPADNPLRAAEAAAVGRIETALERYTVQRDLAQEQMFKAIWTNPLMVALTGEAASFADSRKPKKALDRAYGDLARLKLAAIRARETEGTFVEAVLRVVNAAIKAVGGVDARAMAAAQEIKASHPAFQGLSRAEFLREMREAALMVAFDEDAALEALPLLLKTDAERRDALAVLRKLTEWRPEVAPEVEAVIARVSAILGIEPDGPDGGRKSLPAPDRLDLAVIPATAAPEKPTEAVPLEPAAAAEAMETASALEAAKPAKAPASRRKPAAASRAAPRATTRRTRTPPRSE